MFGSKCECVSIAIHFAVGRIGLRVHVLREEQRAMPAYEEPPVLPGGSFLHLRRGSKAALPESFHRAVGGYPCVQGMVSLRGLPELSTAGKVLPEAGCECTEGGHSEGDLLGEAKSIP